MGEVGSVLRHLAEALEEEARFLGLLGKLPDPDAEIRTRQVFSYHRVADTLRQRAARVDEMEGERSEHPGGTGASPAGGSGQPAGR